MCVCVCVLGRGRGVNIGVELAQGGSSVINRAMRRVTLLYSTLIVCVQCNTVLNIAVQCNYCTLQYRCTGVTESLVYKQSVANPRLQS